MFAILFLFVGGRRVRDSPITFNAIIQSTVAFHAIDGVTKVVEIAGNTQVNPTSVSGTAQHQSVNDMTMGLEVLK